MIKIATDLLKSSRHVVAFTGAGISVESGIPPFRGENGLWNKYNPIFLELSYFNKNPKYAWKKIKEIFYDFFGEAKPNTAHKILSKWEEKGIIKSVITQNIDNLHQRSGSKNVIEFHGTSSILTCTKCGLKVSASKKILKDLPPVCPKCLGLLKPDFVFFSESIPQDAFNKSISEAYKSDVMLVIGTTGEIMPASQIPYIAKENGATIIEINIAKSNYTDTITDIFLEGKATNLFMELNKILI